MRNPLLPLVKSVVKKSLWKFGYALTRVCNADGGFYCRALSGMSGYNISINSDLTVSCACSDSLNSGVIGDLHKHSFREVFEGEGANRFRRTLAEGRLAHQNCKNCCELVSTHKYEADYYAQHFQLPVNGIMVENCSACNYNCIYCDRVNIARSRAAAVISVADMERIARDIRDAGIKAVSFFKLGEPFLDAEILTKVRLLRKYSPDLTLRTSTNGMLINTAEKREAALLFDEIHFSVDGISTEMVNKYQAGADFDAIMANVRAIAAMKRGRGRETPCLVWKYVVFSWNDSPEAVQRVFDSAAGFGFDKILFTQGVTYDKSALSRRYFEKDFIPAGRKPEGYAAGYGMTFNLRNAA